MPPFGPVYPSSATQAALVVEPVAPTVPELVGQLKQRSGLMEKAVIDHASSSSLLLNVLVQETTTVGSVTFTKKTYGTSLSFHQASPDFPH